MILGILRLTSAACGYLIVVLFGIAVWVAFKKRIWFWQDYTDKTISEFGFSKKLRKSVGACCVLIALLHLPFVYGLADLIKPKSPLTFYVFIFPAALFLILTGLTLRHRIRKIHLRLALSFFFFSLLSELYISLQAFRSFSLLVLGASGLTLVLAGVVIATSIFFLQRHKLNGLLEITFLVVESLWLLLFSTALLVIPL